MPGRPRKRPRLATTEGAEQVNEPGWTSRCVCGDNANAKLGAGLMIQCESCDIWQHGPCVGLLSQKDCPRHYYCEQCRPDRHPNLLSTSGTVKVKPEPRSPKVSSDLPLPSSSPEAAVVEKCSDAPAPPPDDINALVALAVANAPPPDDTVDPSSQNQTGDVDMADGPLDPTTSDLRVDAVVNERSPPPPGDNLPPPGDDPDAALHDAVWNSLVASFGLTNELSTQLDDMAASSDLPNTMLPAPVEDGPAPNSDLPSVDLLASLGLSLDDVRAVSNDAQPLSTAEPPETASADLLASMGLTADDLAGIDEPSQGANETITNAALESLRLMLGRPSEPAEADSIPVEWEDADDEDLLDDTMARDGLFSDDEEIDDADLRPEDWDEEGDFNDPEDKVVPGTTTVYRDGMSEKTVYICPTDGCRKRYVRMLNLYNHQRVHVESRPYICAACPLAFTRSHDLKRHIQIHVTSRSFLCQGCDRTFSRLDALKRHKANPKSEDTCRKSKIEHDEEADRQSRAEAKRLLEASTRPLFPPLPNSSSQAVRPINKPRMTSMPTTSMGVHDDLSVSAGEAALQCAHIISVLHQMLIDLPRIKSPTGGGGREDDEVAAVDAILDVLISVKLSRNHAQALRQVLGQIAKVHEEANQARVSTPAPIPVQASIPTPSLIQASSLVPVSASIPVSPTNPTPAPVQTPASAPIPIPVEAPALALPSVLASPSASSALVVG